MVTGDGNALEAHGDVSLLGDVDLAIVEALQQDARIPFTTVASRLGVSEAHVRRRVRSLVEEDVIALTAVADPRVFGLDWMAWLGLSVRPAYVQDVADRLVRLRQIDYVVISSGGFDVMAEVACPTADDLFELLRTIRSLPGVRRTETFVYLRLLQQKFQWGPARSAQTLRPLTLADDRPALDELDVAIIRALQRDGRAPFREIANELDVSERLVSARYARLVHEDVVRVSAVANPLSLGFHAMAWLGIQVYESADFDAVATRLGALPEVSYLVAASGRYELMAEIVCRAPEELLRTLTKRIGSIDGVGQVDTFFYLRLLYRSTAGAWSAARSLAIPSSRATEADSSGGP